MFLLPVEETSQVDWKRNWPSEFAILINHLLKKHGSFVLWPILLKYLIHFYGEKLWKLHYRVITGLAHGWNRQISHS